jgi:gamma-glutamyltranspeptidase/glutathione hydrolase
MNSSFLGKKMIVVAMVIGILALAGTALMAQTSPYNVSTANSDVFQSHRPVQRGTNFAVASGNPLATQAGMIIFMEGGNAFDAMVATQAAMGVAEPSHSGIGGETAMLVKAGNDPKVYNVNGIGTAPKAATIDWYNKNSKGAIPSAGMLATVLPGTFDSWCVTLDRWGTMTLAQVLQPAIDLADKGFPVSDLMANRWKSGQAGLSAYPTTKQLYYASGKPPAAGEIFVNHDIANFMRRLVDAEHQGSDAAVGTAAQKRSKGLQAARDEFYKGSIAREFVAFSKANGGLYEMSDLADYHALIEDPAHSTYRGLDIYKNASATQGPAENIILNILEGYDLKAMGFNSVPYIHTALEAFNLAYADREAYLADMLFVKVPLNGLMSKDYAATRRALINPNKRMDAWTAGDARKFDLPAYQYKAQVWNFDGTTTMVSGLTDKFEPSGLADGPDRSEYAQMLNEMLSKEIAYAGGNTSGAATMDKDGNAAVVSPSLFGGFGAKIVPTGFGFPLNNRGTYFYLDPKHVNALQGGKRPRNTLTPSMATKNGKAYIVYDTPGADGQPHTLAQVLIDIVDFGMNAQDAIEAPKFLSDCLPASSGNHEATPGQVSVESRIPLETVKALEGKGWKVVVDPAYNSAYGCVNVIILDPVTGALSAGADPRREGYAEAW